MTLRTFGFLTLAASLALHGCKGEDKAGALAQQSAGAGQAADGGPEAAARVYGNAIKASDWAAAARLMHPSALRQLRSLFEPLFSIAEMQGSAVQMFGVSAEAMPSTPDTVLFAAFLKNVLAQEEGIGEALNSAQITPLGHVAVGDTMLVVSRTAITLEGTTITQYDVMPFIYDDGQWWALLKADVTNMAAMIQQAVRQQQLQQQQ